MNHPNMPSANEEEFLAKVKQGLFTPPVSGEAISEQALPTKISTLSEIDPALKQFQDEDMRVRIELERNPRIKRFLQNCLNAGHYIDEELQDILRGPRWNKKKKR